MTPREVYATMEAYTWRMDCEHRRIAWLAWHIAALSRARRMPPLAKLIAPKPARRLTGEELKRRRREHEEIIAKIPVDKINEMVKKRGRS